MAPSDAGALVEVRLPASVLVDRPRGGVGPPDAATDAGAARAVGIEGADADPEAEVSRRRG
jgi:hypothetical protein